MIKVGLETHVYISSNRKLFCDCVPQKESCVICRGVPGTLPRFSNQILTKIKPLINSLNSEFTQNLEFYRKHYQYYDLPSGFQRSQHPIKPLAKGGSLTLHDLNTTIHVDKIFLEEDPASKNKTGICHLRAGNPLLEIVTQPCFVGKVESVVKQVSSYLRTLYNLVVDLGVAEPNKTLKTDVNISVSNDKKYQIKNITSLSDICSAIREASKLIAEDKDQFDKTLHYKNQLKYSRMKNRYLFLKDYNLETFEISIQSNHDRITLYKIFNLNKKHHGSHRYLYCKNLYQAIKKSLIEESSLESYLSLDQKEGLEKLKELQDKTKITDKLREIVSNWVILNSLTPIDYTSKTARFLKALKTLKQQLISNSITFNKFILQNIFDRCFK